MVGGPFRGVDTSLALVEAIPVTATVRVEDRTARIAGLIRRVGVAVGGGDGARELAIIAGAAPGRCV